MIDLHGNLFNALGKSVPPYLQNGQHLSVERLIERPREGAWGNREVSPGTARQPPVQPLLERTADQDLLRPVHVG